MRRDIVDSLYAWEDCGGNLIIGNTFSVPVLSNRQSRILRAAIPGIAKALRQAYRASGAWQRLVWNLPYPPTGWETYA